MPRKKTGYSRAEVAAKVTTAIVECLDAGTIPWASGWRGKGGQHTGPVGFGLHVSLSTGKPYRGINTWILEAAAATGGYSDRRWATFNQIRKMGGMVRKGEHGTAVILWKPVTPREGAEVEQQGKGFVLMRSFTVFNVEQADGLELPEDNPDTADVGDLEVTGDAIDELAEAGELARAYFKASGVRLAHVDMPRGSAPHYTPATDRITMPQLQQFDDAETYAAVLFHEITHSTGEPSRLDRESCRTYTTSGRPEEELVAELGAAMLCAHTGIDSSKLVENHAAYIKSWKARIKSDPDIVIKAAQRAQKAVDFVFAQVEEQQAA
jgi:antirestriction protein ArdC